MIRDALQALETGALGTVALVAFILAFALILIRAFTMKKSERERLKHLPLDEIDDVIRPDEGPYGRNHEQEETDATP